MDSRESERLFDGYNTDESEQFTNTYYDIAYVDDTKDDLSQFMILKEVDILQQMEDDIEEISIVLSVPKSQASILLLNHNWSISDVYDKWFSDEHEVRERVGILTENRSKVESYGNNVVCGICFESYSYDKIRSASCGHLFCHDCWVSYISVAITDGCGCLRLMCPEPGCGTTVYKDMIFELVTEGQKKKYLSYLVQFYVEKKNKTIKWCPARDCKHAIGLIMVGNEGIHDVSCVCSHKICWNCNHEAHRPVDCNTMKQWMSKNESDAENLNWLQAFTKPCPKCARPIEKNMGCMHMTCTPPCGFQFCWLCLAPWHAHTRCNQQDNPRHTVEELDKRNQRGALKRYAHYYERWLNNMKAMEKALEDMKVTEREHIPKLCRNQFLPKERLNFIIEAWQQVVESKRVLAWMHTYGFYLTCTKGEAPKKQLFQFLQGQAEHNLETLQDCVEMEMRQFLYKNKKNATKSKKNFGQFSDKLISLTDVTKNYFQNLVTALENGLADVRSRPCATKRRKLK